MTRTGLTVCLVASIAAIGTGCSKDKPAQAPQTTSGTVAGENQANALAASDIFAVLRELREGQVKQGKLAMGSASDPRVKVFAGEVVNDQMARMQREEQLMKVLDIKPRDNAISERVNHFEGQQAAQLKSLSGPTFDQGYLDSQIEYFRMVLDTYDRDLIPNATDSQIRSNLVEGRARANRFLETAQNIRGSLVAHPPQPQPQQPQD